MEGFHTGIDPPSFFFEPPTPESNNSPANSNSLEFNPKPYKSKPIKGPDSLQMAKINSLDKKG